MDAVLGIHRAGMAHALAATRACGTIPVGPRVDQQGHRRGGPAQASCCLAQHLASAVGRERGKRVAARPGTVASMARSAGHAHLPLHQVVVGLEIVVGDRPIGQGRSLGDAVLAGHAERLWCEPPPLAAVEPGSAAQHHGVVVVAEIVGLKGLLAVFVFDGPGIPHRRYALAEPEDGGAVVAHRVPADFCGLEGAASLHYQHRASGCGQHMGSHPTPGPAADHHCVVAILHLVPTDHRRHGVDQIGLTEGEPLVAQFIPAPGFGIGQPAQRLLVHPISLRSR